jgi:hypothetical protein
MLERPAVQQQRRTGTAEERGRLIEDPGRHTDRALLRTLTRERQFERIELERGNLAERQRHGDLERARRTEARTLR